MAEKKIQIQCLNDGNSYEVPVGTTLKELANTLKITSVKDPKTGEDFKVIAGIVNSLLKDLSHMVTEPQTIEFIGYNHPEGRRVYTRSLCFILQHAVREIYPDKVLYIDHSLPSGLYCEIREVKPMDDGRPQIYYVKDAEIDAIKEKINEIISKDIVFEKRQVLSEVAQKIATQHNQPLKAALIKSLGKFGCNMYALDGDMDSFHGPLVYSTDDIKVFDIIGFSNGFCLLMPRLDDQTKVLPMQRQSKIASALEEYSMWSTVVGVQGVGALNEAIMNGKAVDLINLAESLHERKYAAIADQIYQRRGSVKIVMIAGPSSSGKTSTSLRLALQCKVLGLNPKVIELDNYFVDREKTPKDENGKYDFESLHAMDLELLNSQLNDLISGKEIHVPKYDFKLGTHTFQKEALKLEEKDILIMEGIHALNPEMTPSIDSSKIFRVYASALTSLNVDENNHISTSDNRLLRRMVRDNRVRGISPESTIMMWHSVRRGEVRNIFPYQENADAIFNSALIFELPMLKYYAEPLLRRIHEDSPAHAEAVRLLKFLDFIVALSPNEIAAIPPTSIMREFIGGQTL